MIPVPVQYPSALGQLRREIADAVTELFRRPRVAQLYAGQPHPAVEEMHMRVVEARRDASALQVNHPRIRADPFANLFGRTDGHDAIAQNRDSFDFGLFVIHSPDFSIDQNQIGRSLRQDERRKRKRDEEREKLFHWKQYSFSEAICVCIQILCRAIHFAKPCSQFFCLSDGLPRDPRKCEVRPIGRIQKLFEDASKLPRSQPQKIATVIEASVYQRSDYEAWAKKAGL